jgi:ribosomal protein L37AE/L43A
MPTCTRCGAATLQRNSSGIPLCIACSSGPAAAKSESTSNEVQLSLPHE